MTTASLSARRILAVFALGALTVGALAVGAAQPAHAADHPTVTLSPSGDHPISDLTSAGDGAYSVGSDYSCTTNTAGAADSGFLFIVPDALSGPLAYHAGTATLAQFLPTDGYSIADVATNQSNIMSLAGDGSVVATPDFFPGTGWADGQGGNPVTLDSFLTPGTYSLAIVCVSSADFSVKPDTNDPAHLAMAWSTLTVTASTWNVNEDSTGTPPPSSVATTTAIAADATTHELTATVTADSGSAAPTGTVQFTDGGTAVGTGTLSGSGTIATATYQPSTAQLAAGAHSFSATYQPDSGFTASNADGSPAAVTISAPTAATTAVHVVAALSADQTGATVAAAISATGSAATLSDASGTVQFYMDGTDETNKLGTAVTTVLGLAGGTAAGLPAGDHTFTAIYTPDTAASAKYQTSPMSDPSGVVTIPAAHPTALNDGDSGIVAGESYEVTFDPAAFGNGDTVGVVLHSDPVTLANGTAAADGSLVYDFTVPSDLEPGAHTLTFTDSTDPANVVTKTIGFTVADADIDPNDPVSFATDWIVRTASTPAGASGLFVGLFLALSAGAGAWLLYWKRRKAAQS